MDLERTPETSDMIDKSKETAKALFMAHRLPIGTPGHINCAQAVFTFSLLLKREDPRLAEAAAHLGGGVARSGLTCGALTGAALSLGMHDALHPSRSPMANWEEKQSQVIEIVRKFHEKFGSTSCRELTGGIDLVPDEGRAEYNKDLTHLQECWGYVGWVCDQLAEIM